MEEALRIHSMVRVLKRSDRSFCGMGFLAGDGYVLTCMHVVLDALGIPRETRELPGGEVEIVIDFPGLLPIAKTAEAGIFRAYLPVTKDCKRDVAVLKIREAGKLYLTAATLLAINSTSNLPGISCSYFIQKSAANYGWGDGIISEIVLDGRIQINQVLGGSGKLVDRGFSGTPVWVQHFNGVVGMIDQVVPEKGIATFIPNGILMECLPPDIQTQVIPNYLDKLKAPKFPHDYVKRDGLIAQIENLLYYCDQTASGNLVVLVGPSGSGKTNVALDIFYNYKAKKHWFDCKTVYQRSDLFALWANPDETQLVVIDSLVTNHLLYTEGWLKEIKCYILVLTSEDSLAEKLCRQFYRRGSTEKIVRSQGFNLAEATWYLRLGVPGTLIGDLELEHLHHITWGMPLLMDFLKSIILEEEQLIESENRENFYGGKESLKRYLIRGQFSIAEVKVILIDKWLQVLDEPSRVVVGILSFVPIVGMSTAALLKTSGRDKQELQTAISSLSDKGFVQLQFKGLQKDNLLVIHDLIKELVVENRKLDNPTYVDNYIAYLEETRTQPISDNMDLASKVDILMLQMKILFAKVNGGKISYERFFGEMKTLNDSIDQNIPFDSGSAVTSEWIAKLLAKSIPTANCAVLISLGQSVHNFKAHPIMAEAIWQGAQNYDSWARACCIHAAVSHWRRLGNEQCETGRANLSRWMTEYLENPRRFSSHQGDNKEFDKQIDLDVATALGGLCHLGFEDEAICFLESWEFNKVHPCTVASDLVVILYLVSHEKKVDVRSRKAQDLIKKHIQRVADSTALYMADEFLENKGYTTSTRIGQVPIRTTHPFGGTIAAAAYSKEFRQYTYDKGDKLSSIGGIRPERM